jgi:5,5'-dehydrodivanillate O-demethylase
MKAEDNAILTQVGAGTKMGELLRRYWQPVAAVAELDDNPIKPVRLMGEDLVLYKDGSGSYGLIDRRCPHRGADLSYGLLEENGLRCAYHGWCMNKLGSCVEMPFEETVRPQGTFKDRVKTKAYPVAPRGGLLWGYLGPGPAPILPNWEPLTWKHVFRQIVIAEVPCNWFQCQENSIDPIHFEWLHGQVASRDASAGAADRVTWAQSVTKNANTNATNKHLKIAFHEFEYGFTYHRILVGTDENHPLWTVGRVCLWPNAFFTKRFEWRVPVDDTTTLSISLHMDRVPNEQEPYEQKRVPYWYGHTIDPVTKRGIMTHNMNQDLTIWASQGRINDRTKEHLGESDRGIIMMRRKMLEQAELVASGGEPMGLVRGVPEDTPIPLPLVVRDRFIKGYPMSELGWKDQPPEFAEFAGQPAAVREEFLQAMGWYGGR